MESEDKKTRLDVLVKFYNFWLDRQVAIDVDMAYNQRLEIAGQNAADLVEKGKVLMEIETRKNEATKYLSVIENLIKQENENKVSKL